jgi:hypothetical protein
MSLSSAQLSDQHPSPDWGWQKGADIPTAAELDAQSTGQHLIIIKTEGKWTFKKLADGIWERQPATFGEKRTAKDLIEMDADGYWQFVTECQAREGTCWDSCPPYSSPAEQPYGCPTGKKCCLGQGAITTTAPAPAPPLPRIRILQPANNTQISRFYEYRWEDATNSGFYYWRTTRPYALGRIVDNVRSEGNNIYSATIEMIGPGEFEFYICQEEARKCSLPVVFTIR